MPQRIDILNERGYFFEPQLEAVKVPGCNIPEVEAGNTGFDVFTNTVIRVMAMLFPNRLFPFKFPFDVL
jgi:hypothetical protein